MQRIRPSDRSTLSLAGLYEVWYDKSLPDDDPNRVVPTYTIPATRRRPAAVSDGAAGRQQSRHVRGIEGREHREEQRAGAPGAAAC
ncbi:hypothetical protein EV650_3204 [Kribbella kalugense]|uniref:Uncharacterized protein n=1 Tax=Kribbella kalugense TaxID=2512221 RepID=A0A4R8A285_9ACTN|nr:hypothetical protein EV650_3204 [Kribbella kalugense]